MKLKQIAIAADQLLNTLLGGYAGESVSSRCWRLRESQPYKTARPVIDWLFSYWGPNHCEESFKNRKAYTPADEGGSDA